MTLRRCPTCGIEQEMKVGFDNWKNLFKMPTFQDWLTLFMIVMVIFMGYAYSEETKQAREFVDNIDMICMQYNINISSSGNQGGGLLWKPINVSELKNFEDNVKKGMELTGVNITQ